MGKRKKQYDIERIVSNAETLSNSQIYECFIYECEDPEGFEKVEDEITELADLLPEDIAINDLPNIFCGNERTKIYGHATCAATEGHFILVNDNPHRVIFDSTEAAIKAGYRPCAKCMINEYLQWKKAGGNRNDNNSANNDN